jgi:hypothetical protein
MYPHMQHRFHTCENLVSRTRTQYGTHTHTCSNHLIQDLPQFLYNDSISNSTVSSETSYPSLIVILFICATKPGISLLVLLLLKAKVVSSKANVHI